jgi:hypothetical protein
LTRKQLDPPKTLACTHSGFDLTEESHLRAFRGMSGGWGGQKMVAALDRVLTELAA